MSRHNDAPNWTYIAGPASLMVAFLALAISSVIAGHWPWVAVAVFGILTSASNWILMLNLRQNIAALKGQHVRDAYRIGELEQHLRRARSWQN